MGPERQIVAQQLWAVALAVGGREPVACENNVGWRETPDVVFADITDAVYGSCAR